MIKIKANIDEVAILNTEVDFRNPPKMSEIKRNIALMITVSVLQRHNNVKCVAT